MNFHFNQAKKSLLSSINNIVQAKDKFVTSPGKDFTRTRKLPLAKVIEMSLLMEGSSLNSELMNLWECDADVPTASAFIQQKNKINPSAYESIFYDFIQSFKIFKTFYGYRLLAYDGTDLNLYHNPNDQSTYFKSHLKQKGFNQVHINALYDLVNNIYLDVRLQAGRNEDERKALVNIIEENNFDYPVIITIDRGMESYNTIAALQKSGVNFVMRVKDIGSNGIISKSIFPESDEFDTNISFTITKRDPTKSTKNNPEFRCINSKANFNYFDLNKNRDYEMSFRVIRVKLDNGNYEVLATNLSSDSFSTEQIKEIYRMRWGIETSFRTLKYVTGMVNLHSKSLECVKKEILAKFIMFNFCQIIITPIAISKSGLKYQYQVNITMAFKICMKYLKDSLRAIKYDIEKRIRKYILPIRPQRASPRKVRSQKFVSFIYRVV